MEPPPRRRVVGPVDDAEGNGEEELSSAKTAKSPVSASGEALGRGLRWLKKFGIGPQEVPQEGHGLAGEF